MSRSVLLLGGARSGKSAAGQALAESIDAPVAIVVTGQAFDDEMAERIGRHQADRPSGWVTVEAPHELAAGVESVDGDHTLLLDCLTLWISNQVIADVPVGDIEDEADRVARRLVARTARSIVVSNEVGQGIVPGDPLSRRFRDVHGRVNQIFARHLDTTYLVVAGRLLPTLDPAKELR